MEINSGAGAATNAGINYQQRVSAVFLLSCLFKTDISLFFNSDRFNDKVIEFIQLEGTDKIDDLILTINNQEKLFCQIKRKVNLSESKTSDFYKTVEQFMQQYLSNTINENYCLITTSYSSSKITRELAKLTESVRLNDLAFIDNPLNKSEKDTLDKYTKVVKKIYKFYIKQNMSDNEFIKFSKKVFINNFDIESNSPLEKTILILIHTNAVVTPLILWEMMISKCLTFASQRMIVSYDNLYGQYKDLLKISNTESSSDSNAFWDITVNNSNISSGKEVLLCKPNDTLFNMIKENNEKIDYCIIEIYRFDDNCDKKLNFQDNQCILLDGSKLELIARASSNVRIEQFLLENKIRFENSSIALFPASDEIEYVEHTPCTQLYADTLLSKLKLNKNNMECIECGKAISENNALIVEIDEIDFSDEIGLIHSNCLRPTIRILGHIEHELFKEYNISDNFDWELWINKIVNGGQGLLSNDIIYNINKRVKILWNATLDYTKKYNYCIREYLEDNTIRYVLRRGVVERFSKSDAESKAIEINKILSQKKLEKDYLCISNKGKMFGTYNSFKNIIDFDDRLIKIEKYEVEKVTKRIIDEYKTMDNYYAPLVYITIGKNQDIFTINNIVILLSDPLEFNKYIENWKNANIYLDEIEFVIIEDDKYFDNFMHRVFEEYLGAIINPQFNIDGELIKGIEIEKFEEIDVKIMEKI